MLFYVQMRWSYEHYGMKLDDVWEIEEIEAQHAQETIDSGKVIGIYKVAGQKRVIAIVNIETAEDLDRDVFGRLPMRDYLEFEAIWPLRDYAGFAEDVKKRFKDV